MKVLKFSSLFRRYLKSRSKRAVQMRTIIGRGNGGTNLGHLFQFAANQFSDAGALLSAQHIRNLLVIRNRNRNRWWDERRLESVVGRTTIGIGIRKLKSMVAAVGRTAMVVRKSNPVKKMVGR
ncbi:hypothetical protein LXL04_014886 [Taraxacum kok-saghyz]